jgi:DNA-binding transcriptional MerR regulator
MSSDSKGGMLPTRLICARYNITNRTVDRWEKSGILPTPVRINGVRYWRHHELERRERELFQTRTQDQDRRTGTQPYRRERRS